MNQQSSNKEEKILFFLSRDNFNDALEEFYKTFNQENPCSKNFILKLISELNRLKAYTEIFNLLETVDLWFPNDPELVKAEKHTKKNYYFFLCEKANRLLHTAQERAARFKEEASSLDKLYREKLLQENEKAIANLHAEALKHFQDAHSLYSEGFEALFGMLTCYKALGDTEGAKQVQEKLAALTQTPEVEIIKPIETPTQITTPQLPEEPPTYFDLKPLEALYEENKYDKVLEGLDGILQKNDKYVPALILKAKVLIQKKEYILAEHYLDKAIKYDPKNVFALDLRLDFLDHKFKLLTRGGIQFLKKGISLGPTLGREFFLKAVECFEQALEITAGDTIILDHLYTALRYLGQHERAEKIKTEILLYSPNFEITFDKHRYRSLCFIGSFAYKGFPEYIEQFRLFRNRVLLKSRFGLLLNTIYVKYSPNLVSFLIKNHISPKIIRSILYPIYTVIRIFNKLYEGIS